MSNNNKTSSNNSITSTRRKVLGVTTKGSTLLVAKAWLAPTILGVTLPVHAQTSTTKKPGTTSTSGGSGNGGGTGGPSTPGTTATPGGTVAPPTPTEPPLVCSPGASDSGSFPDEPTDIFRSIELSQYDLQVGRLSRATLTYNIQGGSVFSIKNISPQERSFLLNTSIGITMRGPDGNTLLTAEPTGSSVPATLAPNDGTSLTNFNPPSGIMTNGNRAMVSGSIELIGAGIDPNLLIGNGNVSFAFDIIALSNLGGISGNELVLIQTMASAEISIQYECEL